jgi:hypothetical protein
MGVAEDAARWLVHGIHEARPARVLPYGEGDGGEEANAEEELMKLRCRACKGEKEIKTTNSVGEMMERSGWNPIMDGMGDERAAGQRGRRQNCLPNRTRYHSAPFFVLSSTSSCRR